MTTTHHDYVVVQRHAAKIEGSEPARQTPRRRDAERLLATGIIALAIVLTTGQFVGLIVWMAVTFTALILGFWITRSIGGLTGDSYGAIEEVAEVVALLVLVLVRV